MSWVIKEKKRLKLYVKVMKLIFYNKLQYHLVIKFYVFISMFRPLFLSYDIIYNKKNQHCLKMTMLVLLNN